MTKAPKESALSVWKPQLVVPLFRENAELLTLDLPLFPKPKALLPCYGSEAVINGETTQRSELMNRLLGTSVLDIETSAIVVALAVARSGSAYLLELCLRQEPSQLLQEGPAEVEFHCASLVDEAYHVIQQDHPDCRVWSLDEWARLVRRMIRDVHFAVQDHPLLDYANLVLPTLSKIQLEQVRKSLEFSKTSLLGIQKLLRDRVDAEPPRLFSVLLDPEEAKRQTLPLPTSCLPTARLQLVRNNEDEFAVQLHSLLSGGSSTTTTLSVAVCPNAADMDDAGFRDACMQQRFQRSCACIRCRYDLFPFATTLEGSSVEDVLRLARHSLGSGNTTVAETLFQHIQQREGLDDVVASDVVHALGAIALQSGHFIKAQEIWKSAGLTDHPGLMLQRAKLLAYKYLDDEPLSGDVAFRECTWHSPVLGGYIASVVSSAVCSDLVQWAKASNKWTRSRHYAVPTFDIPVHTLSGPFLSWFTEFMQSTMKPLLSSLFGNGRYYVHDAFCVRYDAAATSSYLPVHTDESTHSFVLALNHGGGKDYEGGGTYFFDANETVHLATGSVLCFRGDDMLHGGEPVIQGSRYIVAAFLYKGAASNSDIDVSKVFSTQSEPFSFGFLDV